LKVSYDSIRMMKDAWIDTLNGVNYHNRIEYQLLLTGLKLSKSNADYYKMSFLPELSAYANYNLVYQNDALADLYSRDFPNSSVGLRVSFPIFQGTKRIQQVKRANLQYREMALDTLNLKSRMNTEYEQSMASYKSNLKAYEAALENAQIANEVYNTVRLQYNQGIKTYLEVIVSETDLRTSRINQLNALYRLLSSKIDVENALGTISVNY
jgi:outer membrane protein